VYHVTSRGNEKKAVERYAYRQSEIARHLRLHVSPVSTILRGRGWHHNKRPAPIALLITGVKEIFLD
jgi:hypothetical protein